MGTRINDARGEGKISAEIVLLNNGLGPACASKYFISYDGETLFKNTDDDEDMIRVFAMMEDDFGDYEHERTVFVLGENTWIPAGDKIILLGVGILTGDETARARFKSFFRQLEVRMNYESTYGDGFACDNKASLNQIR